MLNVSLIVYDQKCNYNQFNNLINHNFFTNIPFTSKLQQSFSHYTTKTTIYGIARSLFAKYYKMHFFLVP